MKKLFLILLISLTAVGCATTQGVSFDNVYVYNIQVGVTTESDIIANFGKSVVTNSNNSECSRKLFYRYTKDDGEANFLLFPFRIVGVTPMYEEYQQLSICINDVNLVKKYQYLDSEGMLLVFIDENGKVHKYYTHNSPPLERDGWEKHPNYDAFNK